MTFAIFIVLILGVFIAILNILPSIASFSFDAGAALSVVIGYMRAWNFLFPIGEMLLLLTAVISFEVSVWIWHVLWKVVKFLRGHSDGA